MQYRTERRLFVRRAERELVKVGLPDEDRSCRSQPSDERGIAPGDVTFTHA